MSTVLRYTLAAGESMWRAAVHAAHGTVCSARETCRCFRERTCTLVESVARVPPPPRPAHRGACRMVGAGVCGACGACRARARREAHEARVKTLCGCVCPQNLVCERHTCQAGRRLPHSPLQAYQYLRKNTLAGDRGSESPHHTMLNLLVLSPDTSGARLESKRISQPTTMRNPAYFILRRPDASYLTDYRNTERCTSAFVKCQ